MYDSSLPAALTCASPINQRVLPGLFLGAALTVDLAVAAALRGTAVTAIILYMGLSFGQLALVALWCNRSPLPWLVRGTAATVLTWGFAWGWSRATYATCTEWFVMLGLFTVLVAALVAALPGVFGPARSQLVANAPGAVAGARRCRWSLQQMLGTMTLLALLLGPGRWYLVDGPRSSAAYHLAAVATVASATLVAVHGRIRAMLSVATIAATVLSAGLIVAHIDSTLSTWQFTMAYFLEAGVISWGAELLRHDQKSCRSI